jgi:hypothetical protein
MDMLLSAVSVLVVALSSSEIPEGLMNNPVHKNHEIMELQKTAIIGHCAHIADSTEHSRWEITSYLPSTVITELLRQCLP